jgi:predicted O-methyltransferase YrrM
MTAYGEPRTAPLAVTEAILRAQYTPALMPLRRLAKALLVSAASSSLGRRALRVIVRTQPELVIAPLAETLNRQATYATVQRWPATITGFHDLAFLFTNGQLNHGIASNTFAESAYLYAVTKNAAPRVAVEIGRFKGGSTFVVATALPDGGELWSYDIHAKLQGEFPGALMDQQLHDALERYGLADRVQIIVADSRTAIGPERCDLIFIDGDHTYEGVAADFAHWSPTLGRGGHLLFHDRETEPGVARLLTEIDERRFRRVGNEPGSLAHFVCV